MPHRDLYDHILDSLHEAVFDDDRWNRASGLIDEACGSKGNMLVFGDDSSRRTGVLFARFCYRGRRHQEFEREYYRDWYPVDELLPRLRRLPDGRIVGVDDLYSDEERRRSPMYNEAFARGEVQNALRVRLDGPARSRIFLTLADPVYRDGWTSGRVGTLRAILPRVRHFLRVRQALVESEARGLSAAALLDSDRLGIVELDRRGRIGAANDLAMAILREGDGLLEEDRALRAWPPRYDQELRRLVAAAIPRYRVGGSGGAMVIPRANGAPPLAVHLNPVQRPGTDFRPQGLAAVAIVVDARRRARIDPAHVATVLGLTASEAEVAALVAEGRTVGDIAATTGRSESTVRWHLRHVFGKLGVGRQFDVARLITSISGNPQRLSDLSGFGDGNPPWRR